MDRMSGRIGIDKQNQLNYTPETHESKPRTFGNAQNPSMTSHSMNINANVEYASSHVGSVSNSINESNRTNTFYSRSSNESLPINYQERFQHQNNSKKMSNERQVPQSPLAQTGIYKDEQMVK
jgi:hypothetical protein